MLLKLRKSLFLSKTPKIPFLKFSFRPFSYDESPKRQFRPRHLNYKDYQMNETKNTDIILEDLQNNSAEKIEFIKDLTSKNITINSNSKEETQKYIQDNSFKVSSSHIDMVEHFDQISLNPSVKKGLERFDKIAPVQRITLPTILKGKDLITISKTGSGKTMAFAIPLVEHVLANKKNSSSIQAMVICPTRELATQIVKEIMSIVDHTLVQVRGFVGGFSRLRDMEVLKFSTPNVVVGTPGRIKDLIDSGVMEVNNISHLVLDEMDFMLDIGYLRDISHIIKKMPSNRQLTMWTATFPSHIEKVAMGVMNDPLLVQLSRDVLELNRHIDYQFHLTSNEGKIRLLLDHIREHLEENPNGKILIFCKTKAMTRHLHTTLKERLGSNPYRCEYINSDLTQFHRSMVLKNFNIGKSPVMIATNVAARGLDIRDVTIVCNFDMPNILTEFIHRVGRTGRMGKKGKAVTFLTAVNLPVAKELEKLLISSGIEADEGVSSLLGLAQKERYE